MAERKRLQDLTIKNNFMFGAVMCDENNCKGFLERVLQFPIARVEISREKSIVYHPEYKGVRLDVYAKDEQGTHYDIEMQAIQKAAIDKRCRYYHSQMDMESLLSGEEYENLPNSYVIFICDFDPFGEKKYCYTFENVCLENKELVLKDGCKSIFLSTRGENEGEVSQALVNFLHFVKADLAESEEDFQDEFVSELQKYIKHIKESREMGERFMLFEELLKDERAEGRAEGRREALTDTLISLLEEKGTVPEKLKEKIASESSTENLGNWIKLAAKLQSVEQFFEEM